MPSCHPLAALRRQPRQGLRGRRGILQDADLPKLDATEQREVRLEKSDVRFTEVALVWVPVTRRI